MGYVTVQPETDAHHFLEHFNRADLEQINVFLHARIFPRVFCRESNILEDGPRLMYCRDTAVPIPQTVHTFYDPDHPEQQFRFVGDHGITQLTDLVNVLQQNRD